jgi:glutamine amidotransferase
MTAQRMAGRAVAGAPVARDTVVVVDYHKGNLLSVARGLARAGATPVISDQAAVIKAAPALVLPGVGSFASAQNALVELGLFDLLRERLDAGVPFLGICLGMQLLFERGFEDAPAEGEGLAAAAGEAGRCREAGEFAPAGAPASAPASTPGLGIIPGSCTKLLNTPPASLKVPHMGWDALDITPVGTKCPLLAGVPQGATTYFTHSYAADCEVPQEATAATCHYTRTFASVVWRRNVFGTQFHPEKSSRTGARMLMNFVTLAKEAAWLSCLQ